MMYLIKGYYPAYERTSNSSTEKQAIIFKVSKGPEYFGFFQEKTYKDEYSSPVIIREIQIKTKSLPHPCQNAIIKRMAGSKDWQGHKELGTLVARNIN